MRKKHLKNKSYFSICLHILPSWLFTFYWKILKSVGKSLLLKKVASHKNTSIDLHYKSIGWFPYETSPQCKVFLKRHYINLGNHDSNSSGHKTLKTSKLRCLDDVQNTTSWRRLIYNVLRTSDLRRLEDIRFTSSWKRPIYNVLKTSGLLRFEDV